VLKNKLLMNPEYRPSGGFSDVNPYKTVFDKLTAEK